MIDATFVKALADLATAGSRVEVKSVASEAPGVYFFAKPDGTIERHLAPPPQKKPQFQNLDSLCEWAWQQPNRQVWVSLEGVHITVESPRSDAGYFEIGVSDEVDTLERLEGNLTPYQQRQFIKLLRNELQRCVPPGAVNTFKAITFSNNQAGGAEFSAGRVSMGKTLDAEVKAKTGETLPEQLILAVPPVANPFMPEVRNRQVVCGLDIEPTNQTFVLYPLAGEMSRLRHNASVDLYNLVVTAIVRNKPGFTDGTVDDAKVRAATLLEAPVYIGTP